MPAYRRDMGRAIGRGNRTTPVLRPSTCRRAASCMAEGDQDSTRDARHIWSSMPAAPGRGKLSASLSRCFITRLSRFDSKDAEFIKKMRLAVAPGDGMFCRSCRLHRRRSDRAIYGSDAVGIVLDLSRQAAPQRSQPVGTAAAFQSASVCNPTDRGRPAREQGDYACHIRAERRSCSPASPAP